MIVIVAALLATVPPHPDSPRGRLHELVSSMQETHGGPAYISSADLDEAYRGAERMLDDVLDDNSMDAEEKFASACAHVMDHLHDPLASHLRPAQAVAARERFHGRASVGLKLRFSLVQLGGEEDDAGGASSEARHGLLRWPWPRGSKSGSHLPRSLSAVRPAGVQQASSTL